MIDCDYSWMLTTRKNRNLVLCKQEVCNPILCSLFLCSHCVFSRNTREQYALDTDCCMDRKFYIYLYVTCFLLVSERNIAAIDLVWLLTLTVQRAINRLNFAAQVSIPWNDWCYVRNRFHSYPFWVAMNDYSCTSTGACLHIKQR